MKSKTLKIGTRSSKLALTQTGNVVQKLQAICLDFDFEMVPFSSPGDRDRQTDLKVSDPDFFTRDLDEAVVNSKIDAGVHSAKDLPDELNPALDWFWFPWHEDPRDILVMRKDEDSQITKSPDYQIRIGISSERREEYCRQRFPDAELLPIRGNIEERIAQLDDGKYDLLIMAAAGLNRLGLHDRISAYISLEDMPPPAGQGYLAVTFRKGDRRFEIMRALFVQPVIFAGSGPGDPELATAACIRALKHCGICLYDSLAPVELLEHLPENAEAIYVGKRSGKHSKKQEEICQLITQYARQGKAVVRLKGGDAGIFGRVGEEIDALDELSMPYRVIPGISSMQSASASTGLLLTRRGISRGFSVMTPRRTGSADYEYVSPEENLKFPRVYFMGKSVLFQITDDLLKEGWDADTPAAVIFAAGSDAEFVVTGEVANIAEKVQAIDNHDQPGLLIVGSIADEKFLYQQNTAMADKKILITCSEHLHEKASCEIRRFGGKPVPLPLIELQPAICSATVPGCDFSGSKLSSVAASLKNFDFKNYLEISERRLPHWEQEGVTYFVTFRLADSIPESKIKEIRYQQELWKQRNASFCNTTVPGCDFVARPSSVANSSLDFSALSQHEKDEYYRLFTKEVQDLLDSGEGSCLFANNEAAKIVGDSIKHFAGKKYSLGDWVVMPNHVHALVTPLKQYKLSEILSGWKSFSSRNINKLLGRKGQLWCYETYDHIVRNEKQLQAFEKYIRNNPKKINLKHFQGSFGWEEIATGDGCATKESQPGTVALQKNRNRGRSRYKDFDYLLLTSPGAVKMFLENADVDVRELPKIMVCGSGTAGEFRKKGIFPELIAEDDFGTAGLLKTAEKVLTSGTRILRLCSDKAGEKLSCELRKLGCEVEDRILYHNILRQYEELPEFDGVIFASSSAVKAFVDNFGKDKVAGKIISVIGEPTLETVRELLSPCEVVKAREATIPETVSVLAEYYVNEKLINELNLP